jgi:hypothetical protein
MNWFQKLLPREDKFFDLFERHAQILVDGAEALRNVLEAGDDLDRYRRVVIAKENEADQIVREVMESVRRTFITPFDRGDIQALIQSMDDAIDQMNQTVKTITLFEVSTFDATMREMASLAIGAARLTKKSLPGLREIAAHAGEITAYAEAVVQLEERADQLHDAGLRRLLARRIGYCRRPPVVLQPIRPRVRSARR